MNNANNVDRVDRADMQPIAPPHLQPPQFEENNVVGAARLEEITYQGLPPNFDHSCGGKYVFDNTAAERILNFFARRCYHTKGRWRGQPFQLLPWQVDVLLNTFGWINPETGYRKYRTVYIEVPKKNGKTEVIGGVANYLTFSDKEPGAENYIAAGDKKQASILFDVAAQMIRLGAENHNPALLNRCEIIDSRKRIYAPQDNNVLEALSAESYTKHGVMPHGILFDEVHAQPNRELFDTLTTGSTITRAQPININTTTAGVDRRSLCYALHDYACKIYTGFLADETFLPCLYSLGLKEAWDNPANWIKVNPAYGFIFDLDRIKQEFIAARQVPGMENSFRRMRLNQWVQQITRWIPLNYWSDCAQIKFTLEYLKGRRCYGGLDLSDTTALTAFALVFPPDAGDTTTPYFVLIYYWLPADDIKERVRRDRVPYDLWADKGFIDLTPGNVIDYHYIVETIKAVANMFDLVEVAYDRWGAAKIATDLQDAGIELIQHGQGFASMSPVSKDFITFLLQGRIAHGNNPVLNWQAENVSVAVDPARNIKPVKNDHPAGFVDGIIALIMALGRAVNASNIEDDNESVYSTEPLLVLR